MNWILGCLALIEVNTSTSWQKDRASTHIVICTVTGQMRTLNWNSTWTTSERIIAPVNHTCEGVDNRHGWRGLKRIVILATKAHYVIPAFLKHNSLKPFVFVAVRFGFHSKLLPSSWNTRLTYNATLFQWLQCSWVDTSCKFCLLPGCKSHLNCASNDWDKCPVGHA